MTGPGLQVIILCGLPFSGKSTLARALAERLDLVVIEVDQAVREAEGFVPAQPIPRKVWITAYRVSYRRMEHALAAGRSVVLDATNYRRLHRDLIRSKAARFGALATVVFLDTPEAEIQTRRDANYLSQTRPDVGDDDFQLVRNDIQEPGPDEHTVHYRLEQDIETLVARLRAANVE